MAIHPALASVTKGFVDRGRTLESTHTVDLAEMSHRPAFLELLDSPDGVTHLDVVVAKGPLGVDVLIQPRAGEQALPAELYSQVPGALGAPAVFGKTAEPGLAWVSPNGQLQEYLRTHQFGAPSLPGGQRNGEHEITFDWTVQLNALGGDQSMMVCQLSGNEPNAVAIALAIVDHLAKVTSQSRAAGPQDGLSPLRFSFVVGLALTDQLGVLPPPPMTAAPSAPVAAPPPAPAPAPPVAATPPAPAAPVATPEPVEAATGFESFETSFTSIDTLDEPVPEPTASFDTAGRSWEASAPGAVSIDARAKVTEALSRYEGKRVSVGAITDPKKLNNVLRNIAPEVGADEMCGFVDTGARANGKSGVVFTPTSLYSSGVGGRRQYDYAVIEAFELESTSVVITVEEGRRVKIPTAGQSLAIAEAVAAATGLSV